MDLEAKQGTMFSQALLPISMEFHQEENRRHRRRPKNPAVKKIGLDSIRAMMNLKSMNL